MVNVSVSWRAEVRPQFVECDGVSMAWFSPSFRFVFFPACAGVLARDRLLVAALRWSAAQPVAVADVRLCIIALCPF